MKKILLFSIDEGFFRYSVSNEIYVYDGKKFVDFNQALDCLLAKEKCRASVRKILAPTISELEIAFGKDKAKKLLDKLYQLKEYNVLVYFVNIDEYFKNKNM